MKKSGFIGKVVGVFCLSIFVFPVFTVAAASDTYANYAELSAARVQGTDYQISSRNTSSTTAIIAIHGGLIEPGTKELADTIAGTQFDFYSFSGIMSKNNTALHITSTNFDEPVARSLVESDQKTLSIHGFSSSDKLTYVSGLDSTMVNKVKASLIAAGFQVADPPANLAGTSVTNICNDNLNHAGVQIELSNGLRSSFFAGLTTKGLQIKTSEFTKYTNAIKAAIV